MDLEKAWVVPSDICERLDWKGIFGNDHPVELELGAGDGGFIAAYAPLHPNRNFLAVERLLGRARKIAKKTARLNLSNLRVLRLESSYTLRYLVPPASICAIHLMFPDPWPKRRHQDRRLVQLNFVRDAATALTAGGEFRFTTDHEDYFEAVGACFAQEKAFESVPIWDLKDYPETDFEKTFNQEGRRIQRACWKRV